jgi:hypothetical protein
MANIFRLAFVALCAVTVVTIAQEPSLPAKPNANNKPRGNPNDELICITPKRVTMAPRVQTGCLPSLRPSPHVDAAEILVYANRIALDYRRKHPKSISYPVGSKFVKEKFATASDNQPDAATIMKKTIDKGSVSDWQFSSVSLPDNGPLKSSSRTSCVACHKEYAKTGYVSPESETAIQTFLKIE